MHSRAIHTVVLWICFTGLGAQSPGLELIPLDREIRGIAPRQIVVADSLEAMKVLRESLQELRGMGYLAASADSIVFDSTGGQAWIWAGPRLSWGKLCFASIQATVLRGARVRPARFEDRFVRADRVSGVQARILDYYENTGHPFARIWIDQLSIEGDGISGMLRVEPGELFLFDSLYMKGNARIHATYLQKLTGIVPGEAYREDMVRKMPSRIRGSVFLEEARPPELEFYRGSVDVYTYLNRNRASQFSGIIGMLPDHGKTGKLLVTGEIGLSLLNAIGRGEQFRFGWRSLEPRTQDLQVGIGYPYILGSNMGVDFRFDLLKQDTTYISLNPVIDLRFQLGGANYLNAFLDHFSSSVIGTGTIEDAEMLPPYADVTGSLYGLGVRYVNLDRPVNPCRGWDIEARIGIGNRRIRKNPAIREQAYEGVDLNSTKMRSIATASFFRPITGRFVLHFRGQAGLVSSDRLFENELFRIGGFHTLRGTDENSIYASAFGTFTIEPRFVLEQGSAFYLFFDQGWYEKAMEDYTSDHPMGFGAGLELSTGAGIFQINYALGRQFDNPLILREAKIHLGYLNRF